MAIKQHREKIDGVQYEFTLLGAVEGVDLFHELRKVVLPTLKRLLSGDVVKGLFASDEKVDLEKLEKEHLGELLGLVLELFEAMPKALERDLRHAFARAGKVALPEAPTVFVPFGDAEQADGIFDQHFAGAYGRYQKWLIAGLKFNFASFLGGMGSSAAPAGPPTP